MHFNCAKEGKEFCSFFHYYVFLKMQYPVQKSLWKQCLHSPASINILSFAFYLFFVLKIFMATFIIYFPLPFIPPIPTTTSSHPFPSNHCTLVHVHEYFFLFAGSLHHLNPPPELSACYLYMTLSLFCLLVQFVHQTPHMSEII